MLTVAKVTGRQAAGYAEYLEGKTQEPELGDYYLKDGERVEAPGRWVSGASAVGCDPAAAVPGGVLRELMAVRRPDTGEQLRRAGGSGQAVAALDATFSALKSVSAVWAVSDRDLRERIEQAHETAIDRAIAYALRQVRMIRERQSAEVVHARAAGLIATSWRHTTARAVGERPPDPQLHSHVLLHAAVRRDGEVVAIDSRSWLTHRREIGAAYRTELARELATLGFTIQRGTGRGGRYFELEGVPAGLIDRWSSRHHQVRAAIDERLTAKEAELSETVEQDGPEASEAARQLHELRRHRQLTGAEDRYMSYTSRAAKQMHTRRDLDQHWQRTAREHSFHADGACGLRGEPAVVEPAEPHRLAVRLTEFNATFSDRDARAIALEQSCGTPIEQALARLNELHDQHQLLRLQDGRLTTARQRALERSTAGAARELAASHGGRLDEPTVHQEIAKLERDVAAGGGELTAEQRRAVEIACSGSRLVVIEGQAGTGKSTVLAAVARAHQQHDRQILVTSTSALAAQRLARELATAGVAVRAYSTVGLLHSLEAGQFALDAQTTVIHDEAALASTRELEPLLKLAERSGASVILVGDPRQSHAVGAGGMWPYLEHAARERCAHVELTRNVRAQDTDDRRDQQRFRAGEYEAAIGGYHERGRVHLHPDRREAEDAALEQADADRRRGDDVLVIAQTSNEHLDELNARAQALRRQNGELGRETLALTGRPYELRAGDEIQIRHTILDPEHGTLRNGTAATISSIDPRADSASLLLADGRQVRRSDGWCRWSAPARGNRCCTYASRTAAWSSCVRSSSGEHVSREGTYVALSRARHSTHLHASHDLLPEDEDVGPVARLAEHLSRAEPDLPSIATALAHEQQLIRDPDQAKQRQRDEPERAEPAATILGPRPADGGPQAEAWDRATETIHAYRERYSIDPLDPRPLGPEPPAGQFERRLARRNAAQEIAAAARELGRESDTDAVVRDLPHAERPQPARELGEGYEP